MGFVVRSLFVAAAVSLTACTDDEPSRGNGDGSSTGGTSGTSTGGTSGASGTAGTSGGTSGASSGGAVGAGGMQPVCNQVELDAPAVGFTVSPDPAPEPLGGEIADGTYVLTSIVVYETSLGITDPFLRAQVVIAGTRWQEVESGPDPGDEVRRRTTTAVTNGTTLTLTVVCPSTGEPDSGTYTATEDELVIYAVDAGITVGSVLTKQ